MEKTTLTIDKIFDFVNECMDNNIELKAYGSSTIVTKNFEITLFNNELIITTPYCNSISYHITDLQKAQWTVLVEIVKDYSRQLTEDIILNYFNNDEQEGVCKDMNDID